MGRNLGLFDRLFVMRKPRKIEWTNNNDTTFTFRLFYCPTLSNSQPTTTATACAFHNEGILFSCCCCFLVSSTFCSYFDRTRCGRLLIRSFTAIRPRASLVPPSVNTRRHDSNSISRPLDDFTRASSFWRRKKKKPKQKNFLFWTGMESINSRVCTISKCFVVLGSQRMPTLADIRAAGGLASRFGAHRNGNRRRWVFLLNNNNIFITWSL